MKRHDARVRERAIAEAQEKHRHQVADLRAQIAADIMSTVPCGALCPVMGGAPCTCDYAADLAARVALGEDILR